MHKDTKLAYNTILAMRATASKNDKIALLAAQEGNAFLKEYLRLMYEPRVNFYMKKVEPKFATRTFAATMDFEALESILTICRHSRGHTSREHVANLHQSFATNEERELLELLINRDAKSGFGANTINKVWSDLITDVPYMRCSLPAASNLDRFDWKGGVYSQLKCDGMFANVTHNADGYVTIESRSGSPFPVEAPMFFGIISTFKTKVHPGIQTHGELLVYKDNEVMARQIGNGMLNSILQGGDIKPGYEVRYLVWDTIPESEARPKNKFKMAYKDRFATLVKMFGATSETAAVQIVETRIVHSMKEAGEHYKEVLLRGMEGTVMKNPAGIWEDTTSKNQVKFKLEAECELKVVGYNTGTGKNAELFGSLQCQSECGELEVNVTGFSDELRAELFEDIDTLTNGAIVTVKSNCLMPPSGNNSKWSLFLPRFEEVRKDKKTADTLQRIKDQFDAAVEAIGE